MVTAVCRLALMQGFSRRAGLPVEAWAARDKL
jgi:hypothetical protein